MIKKIILFSIALFVLNLTYAQSWNELTTGTTKSLFDIDFPPGQNTVGFACGATHVSDSEGVLIKTTDAGNTWTELFPSTGTFDHLHAVAFTSVDTGYIGGWDDFLAKTTDGGATWTELTVSTGAKVCYDIEFWDADNGIALFRTPHTWDSFVYVTDDAGDTWTQGTGFVEGGAVDLAYSDANTIFAVGGIDQYIWESNDGGLSWSLNYEGAFNQFLLGVDFEGDYGVAVGSQGDRFVTTDQGATWILSSLANGKNYEGIHVFNSDSTYYGGVEEEMLKTTNGGSTWEGEYDGPGMNHFYEIIFTVDGFGFACMSSGHILRKDANLSVGFTADQTSICTGTTVNFTDESIAASTWSWVFEGGTPATSTDQNPSVTYNTPGFYDVSLTVTKGSESLTEVKEDYIAVLDIPAKADTPEGEDEVCGGVEYYYSTTEVIYAQEYEWEINPSSAGTVYNTLNNATVTMDVDFTGDFSLHVRAVNMCYEGEWSDDLEGVVYPSVLIYNLEGGGAFCEGSEGAELTLSGSDIGVDYELFLDAVATGIIASGTGSEISFGNVTEEGYYEALAFTDNCEVQMNSQVYVFAEYAPEAPAAPTGPSVVCDDESSDYTSDGTNDADSYSWTLSPEEAGTIAGEGLNAIVTWNTGFVGTAMVSISGINDCGSGEPSSLDVTVGAANPTISGENIVCDFSSEVYEVEDHEGSNYEWEVTGGIIAEGQGTYMITVDWNGEGDGIISVLEETADGCEGDSEEFEVLVDDCTGVSENSFTTVSIHPNPASDFLNIVAGITIETVKVYELTGKEIMQLRVGSEKHILNTSELMPGMYLVEVRTAQSRVVKRVIIK